VIGLASLLAANLLFGVLAYRAVRASRRWVKLAGDIPAVLLALLCGAGLVLAPVGYNNLNAVRPNPVPQLRAAITPQLVADGQRLASPCAGCHSSDGQPPLGGHDFFGTDGPPIGTLWAPNLTPAPLAAWSDGEIVRAIREGVGRDGRTLLVMPSGSLRNLREADVLALMAYLRAQPSVEPPRPPRQINAIGAIVRRSSPTPS
jgi:mono/diheme cytochrome c family protein